MTRHAMPRFALALLERFVPDSEALAGDLIEEFERSESGTWLWYQVLAAIVTNLSGRSHTIRPLRLVDVQPSDAVERSDRMHRRDRAISLSASPLPSVGGLGLASTVMFVTHLVPHAWWVVIAPASGGLLLGVAMIAMRPRSPDPALTIRPS
jgi:hypothetical protein